MTEPRIFPGLGLVGAWPLDDDTYKPALDADLRTLSVVAQLTVLSRVTALPGSPTNGMIYIVPSGGDANKVAVRDDGAWVYLVPGEGWFAWVADEDVLYVFDGAAWTAFSSGGGGGGGTWGSITGDLEDQTDLQAALDAKQSIDEKGEPYGYAGLNGIGQVMASQLPGGENVEYYADFASFPGTGDIGIIYIALDTDTSYIWDDDGSIYIEQTSTGTLPSNVGFKKPCRLLATTNIDLATGGVISCDGKNSKTGYRILVGPFQTDPAECGIYVANDAGAWSRAEDANTVAEIRGGLVTVYQGATYGSSVWFTTFKQGNTLGTTAMNWFQIAHGDNIIDLIDTILGNTDWRSGLTDTDDLTEGTTNLYFTEVRVLGTEIAGLSVVDDTPVADGDTILEAVGKLQAQINDLPTDSDVTAAIAAGIAANDAMVFKGVIDASSNPNYPAGERGETYKISVAGKIGGASGLNVEIGDAIICLDDGTSAGTQAAQGSHWTILQGNIDGAVTGPASATDEYAAVADGTSGRLIKFLSWATVATSKLNSIIAPVWTNITSIPAAISGIAGLSPSNDDVLQRKAGAWANRTMSQLATDLASFFLNVTLTSPADNDIVQRKSGGFVNRTLAQFMADLSFPGTATKGVLNPTGTPSGKYAKDDGTWDTPSAATLKPSLQFFPYDNEPPTSAYATLGIRNQHPTLDFDPSSVEGAIFSAIMPSSYAGGNIEITIYWCANGATSGDVIWRMVFERVTGQDIDSDSFASNNDSAASTASGTDGILTAVTTTITAGAGGTDSIAAGEMFRLKIQRNASSGSDTLTVDAQLLGVKMKEA